MSSVSCGPRIRHSRQARPQSVFLTLARAQSVFLALLLASLCATVLCAPGVASADEPTPLSTSVSAPVLTVSAGTVHWSPIALEDHYGVAISNDARGAADRVTQYLTIAREPGETQSYTPSLKPGETAYIGISADDGATWSEQEAVVSAPESVPTAPVLTVAGSTVRWSPIALEDHYGVAISNDARGAADRVTYYLTLPRQAGETQSYTPNLKPGETAYIGISADDGATWSEQEAAVSPEPESEPEPESSPEPAPGPEPEPSPEPETEKAPETAPVTASSPPAPVLSAHGNTVSWTAIPGVASYTFATVRNPDSTRNTTYRTVTGTSYTPPVASGQTVNYGLAARTPVGGPWAREVSIAYPTQTPPPPPPSEEPPRTPSGSFGLPFARGVVANLQGWGVTNLPLLATEMKSLGANWEREDLSWDSVEAQKGVFNWTRFDQTVAAAKAHGITILPIVGYAPSWTSPTDAGAYAEFVKAAVARYGPGTQANLQWWELWNEPYFAYAWSGHTPEPEAYARDVLAAAQAAKSVAPSVKLLVAADYQGQPQVGGTTSSQTSWIDDMFTAAPTLGKWIDGVSVHPYGGDPATPLKETGGYRDTNGVWGFQRIDTIRSEFLAHGVDVPFWITEEGWSTWDNSEETVTHRYADLFPQIKARPWIRALFPFGLREGTAHPTNDQAGYGLLRFGTWQPKASWTVIQEGFRTLN
jgi:hypothetical protein